MVSLSLIAAFTLVAVPAAACTLLSYLGCVLTIHADEWDNTITRNSNNRGLSRY